MADLAPTGTAHGFLLDGTTPNNDVNASAVIDANDATGWATGGGGGVWVLTLPASELVNDTIRVWWIGNSGSVMHIDTSVDGSSWSDTGLSSTQLVDYGSGSQALFDVSGAPITSRYWRWRTTAPDSGAFALMTFELNYTNNLTANTIHVVVHVVSASAPLFVSAGTIHERVHVPSAFAPTAPSIPPAPAVPILVGSMPITSPYVGPNPASPGALSLIGATFDTTGTSSDTAYSTSGVAVIDSTRFVRLSDSGADSWNVRVGTIDTVTGAIAYGSAISNVSGAPAILPFMRVVGNPGRGYKLVMFWPTAGAWKYYTYSVNPSTGAFSSQTTATVETTSFSTTNTNVGVPNMGLLNDVWVYAMSQRGSGNGRMQRSTSFKYGAASIAVDTTANVAVGTATLDHPVHYGWITRDKQRAVAAWRDYIVDTKVVMTHLYREDGALHPAPDAAVVYTLPSASDAWGMATFDRSPALFCVGNSSSNITVTPVTYTTTEDDSTVTVGSPTTLALGYTTSDATLPIVNASTLDESNVMITAMGKQAVGTYRLSMWIANRADNGTITYTSRLDKDYTTGSTFGPTLGQASATLVARKWALVSVAAPKANLLTVELLRT